jgi:hypothetical protein
MMTVREARGSRNGVTAIRTKHRVAAFALAVAVSAAGCGSGGSGGEDDQFTKALQAVQSAAAPSLRTWSDNAATSASEQLQAAGALDLPKLASGARNTAKQVTDTACEAVDNNKALRKPPDPSKDGSEGLAGFVELQAVRSLGRHPRVLYASKAPWPKTWLRDGTSSPSYDGDPTTIDPLFLKMLLQDRFVSPEGAFLPPEPGTPDYPTLVSWLKQDSNSFDVVVFSLTDPVISAIRKCIGSESSGQ